MSDQVEGKCAIRLTIPHVSWETRWSYFPVVSVGIRNRQQNHVNINRKEVGRKNKSVLTEKDDYLSRTYLNKSLYAYIVQHFLFFSVENYLALLVILSEHKV